MILTPFIVKNQAKVHGFPASVNHKSERISPYRERNDVSFDSSKKIIVPRSNAEPLIPSMANYTQSILRANPYIKKEPKASQSQIYENSQLMQTEKMSFQQPRENAHIPVPIYCPTEPVRSASNSNAIDRKNLRNYAFRQLAPSYIPQTNATQLSNPHPPIQPSQYFINYNNNGCVINNLTGGTYDFSAGTGIGITQKIPSTSQDKIPEDKKLTDRGRTVSEENNRRKYIYKPYTLKDYNSIKPVRYYCLGGLGANIGTPDWQNRKAKLDRMHEFARSADLINRIRLEKNTRGDFITDFRMQPDQTVVQNLKQKINEYGQTPPRPRKYANWKISKTTNTEKAVSFMDIKL